MNAREIVPFFLILLTFGFTLFYQPRMPEKVAIHFDLNGQPDRWVSKRIGVWLIPVLAIVGYALLTVFDMYFPKVFLFHGKLVVLFSLLNAQIAVFYYALGTVHSVHAVLAPTYLVTVLYPLYILYRLNKQ